MNIGVEIVSILLQIAAMALAMRLIRISGSSLAWISITMGIAGMAGRRIWSLYETVVAGRQGDMFFDVLGLATSLCMVTGVALIGPIFTSLKDFQAEQKRLIDELREAMGEDPDTAGVPAHLLLLQEDQGRPRLLEPDRVLYQGPLRGRVQPQHLSGMRHKAVPGILYGG